MNIKFLFMSLLMGGLFFSCSNKKGISFEEVFPMNHIDSIRVFRPSEEAVTFKQQHLNEFYNRVGKGTYIKTEGIKEGQMFIDYFLVGQQKPYTGKINNQYFSIDKRALKESDLLGNDSLNFEVVFKTNSNITF